MDSGLWGILWRWFVCEWLLERWCWVRLYGVVRREDLWDLHSVHIELEDWEVWC